MGARPRLGVTCAARGLQWTAGEEGYHHLDHGDVVAAVADGGGDALRVLLDQPHDLGLLRRRAAAADDRRRRARHLHEEVLVVLHARLHRRAVEDCRSRQSKARHRRREREREREREQRSFGRILLCESRDSD